MKDISHGLEEFLNYVAGTTSNDSFVKKLEAALTEAKKNRKWRHEYMTLFMRDQENLEKGRKQGIKIGAVYGWILAYKDDNLPDEVIVKKLQNRFHFSEDEAWKYLEETPLYETIDL